MAPNIHQFVVQVETALKARPVTCFRWAISGLNTRCARIVELPGLEVVVAEEGEIHILVLVVRTVNRDAAGSVERLVEGFGRSKGAAFAFVPGFCEEWLGFGFGWRFVGGGGSGAGGRDIGFEKAGYYGEGERYQEEGKARSHVAFEYRFEFGREWLRRGYGETA